MDQLSESRASEKPGRKMACVAMLLLATALGSSGCMTGPSVLATQAGDWQNRNYEESPLVTGIFTTVIPFYPIVIGLAMIPDSVFNAIQFWGYDLWDGSGAPRVHDNPKDKHIPFFATRMHEEHASVATKGDENP